MSILEGSQASSDSAGRSSGASRRWTRQEALRIGASTSTVSVDIAPALRQCTSYRSRTSAGHGDESTGDTNGNDR